MQPHVLGLLAVRDIEPERPDRRFHAGAHAVTIDGRERAGFIGRVAGVDERGDAPYGRDPARDLRARHRVVASADDSIPLVRAEARERVAANGRVAPRAKQQRARNVVPRSNQDRAAFRAQLQLYVGSERNPP